MGRYAGILVALFMAGCASAPAPPPQVATAQPATPQPTPQPAATPAASKPADKPVAATTAAPAAPPVLPSGRAAAAPPAVKAPAPQTARRGGAPAAVAPKPAAPAVAAPRAAAAAPLDLEALKARLRATTAIGVFTKLSLKNKVDDLMKPHWDNKWVEGR